MPGSWTKAIGKFISRIGAAPALFGGQRSLCVSAVCVPLLLAALLQGAATIGQTSERYTPAYPLRPSANNRYLVDQVGRPFLIVGDSPQNLITNLSEAETNYYMVNRRRYGINTLWINLLCVYSQACNRRAETSDGIVPFTIPGDLGTPNSKYFERVDNIIKLAATQGMLVLLDPIETSSWLGVLRMNGVTQAYAYGQYLGNRYRNFPNIIWMHGNDFQSWRNAGDDELVQAVAHGIMSMDHEHIHTLELDYLTSGSLDDASWAPLVQLSAAYTYFPSYAQVLREYNRSNPKPVFMVESNYEFEQIYLTDGGSTAEPKTAGVLDDAERGHGAALRQCF